jgi:hypothetical protein
MKVRTTQIFIFRKSDSTCVDDLGCQPLTFIAANRLRTQEGVPSTSFDHHIPVSDGRRRQQDSAPGHRPTKD